MIFFSCRFCTAELLGSSFVHFTTFAYHIFLFMIKLDAGGD
jgi:hypothetical protein